jgi:hypothetical protein
LQLILGLDNQLLDLALSNTLLNLLRCDLRLHYRHPFIDQLLGVASVSSLAGHLLQSAQNLGVNGG